MQHYISKSTKGLADIANSIGFLVNTLTSKYVASYMFTP